MSQVDETTEIIKRAVHDIQPGQKDTVMVACLMRIYDAVMNQREHNPSWQLSTEIFDEVRRKIPKRHESMDTTGQTK